jgi:hypothetical protein
MSFTNQICSINHLPNEIFYGIVSDFSYREWSDLTLVCSQWCAFFTDTAKRVEGLFISAVKVNINIDGKPYNRFFSLSIYKKIKKATKVWEFCAIAGQLVACGIKEGALELSQKLSDNQDKFQFFASLGYQLSAAGQIGDALALARLLPFQFCANPALPARTQDFRSPIICSSVKKLVSLGKLEKALALTETEKMKEPYLSMALAPIGEAFLYQGEIEKAQAVAGRIMKRTFRLGLVYEIEMFNKTISDPNDYKDHTVLFTKIARAYLKDGDKATACAFACKIADESVQRALLEEIEAPNDGFVNPQSGSDSDGYESSTL